MFNFSVKKQKKNLGSIFFRNNLELRCLEARIVLDASGDILVDDFLANVSLSKISNEERDREFLSDAIETNFDFSREEQESLFVIPSFVDFSSGKEVFYEEAFVFGGIEKGLSEIILHKVDFDGGEGREELIDTVEVFLKNDEAGDRLYFWNYGQINGFTKEGIVPCFKGVDWVWDDDSKILRLSGRASLKEYGYILDDVCFLFSSQRENFFREIWIRSEDIEGRISSFNFSIDFFGVEGTRIKNIYSFLDVKKEEGVRIWDGARVGKNGGDIIVSMELFVENGNSGDKVYVGNFLGERLSEGVFLDFKHLAWEWYEEAKGLNNIWNGQCF